MDTWAHAHGHGHAHTHTHTHTPNENYTQTDMIPQSTMYTQTQHDNNTQTIGTYPHATNTNLPVYQSNYARSLQNVPIEHMQIQLVGYTQNRSIEYDHALPLTYIQPTAQRQIEHMQTDTQIEQTNNQVSPNPSPQQRSIEQIQIQPITHTQNQPIAHTQIQPIGYTQNHPIAHTQIQPIAHTQNKPIAHTQNHPVAYTQIQPMAYTQN